MTVPHDDAPHKHPHALQARGGTTRPPGAVHPAALDVPDNDAEPGPAVCPTCGKPWRPPFEARYSGMLDMVLLAKDVLSDLQAALEEECRP